MADNVSITPGVGADISAEEVTTLNGSAVSAVKVQRTGIALVTANGTAVDLPGDATNGLTVNLGANNDVTVTGTVTAQDGGGSLTVDNVALSVVGGGLEATALRVTMASDSTGVISVDDNGGSLTVDGSVSVSGTVPVTDNGGSLTVDGTVALGAGSASIGTLGANSGVDIGDVTINNATGAAAVNIQDGGNSITVDGTVAVSGTVAVTDNGSTLSVDDGAGSLTIDNAALSVTGGGVEASALRVTIANDSTGVVSVDDNGGSLTVDGTIAATQSGTWNVGTVTTVTTVSAVTAISNALPAGTNNIGDVDVLSVVPGTGATALGKAVDSAVGATDTGVALLAVRDDSLATLTPADGDYTHLRVNSQGALHVTGAGGGTQYVEDTAHTTGDIGTMLLAVRRDADTTLVDTTGDYAPLQVNAAGSLKVAITAGAGSGGTSLADNAGFTAGTTSFTPIGGFVDDTGTTAASENSAGIVRMTPQRAFHVNLRANDGSELTVGGATQYAEDVPHQSGDQLTIAGTVRSNTAAATSGADGDYQPLITDTNGRLHVIEPSAAASLTALQLIDNLPNTIGSTTSGQSGVLSQGAVTTAAPTYTTAQTHPLSLQTDGSLRTAVTNTVTVASHAVTNAGTFATQVDGAALTALQLIDNLPNTLGSTTSGQSGALVLGAVTTSAPTYTTAQSNALSLQTDGSVRAAITNTVTVGSHAVTNAGTFAVQPSAGTSGGWTPGKLISAASTNATSVKGSAGQVGYLQVTNINAAVRYLKIYNKATAPTVGSDTPVQSFGIPGNTAGAGFTLSFGPGMELTTGFAFALTTGAADADTGAVASGEIIVNYGYR